MTDAELIERYQAKQTMKVIAEAAGCKPVTIAKRLSKLRDEGAPIGYRREPLSKDHPRRVRAKLRRELVSQLHSEGVSVTEIAAHTGLAESTIGTLSPQIDPSQYATEIEALQSQLRRTK